MGLATIATLIIVTGCCITTSPYRRKTHHRTIMFRRRDANPCKIPDAFQRRMPRYRTPRREPRIRYRPRKRHR